VYLIGNTQTIDSSFEPMYHLRNYLEIMWEHISHLSWSFAVFDQYILYLVYLFYFVANKMKYNNENVRHFYCETGQINNLAIQKIWADR